MDSHQLIWIGGGVFTEMAVVRVIAGVKPGKPSSSLRKVRLLWMKIKLFN